MRRDRTRASREPWAAHRRVGFALLVIMTALVLVVPSASALKRRGHTFSFSFGEPGKGEGQLLGAYDVAVNHETGAVYVADRTGNRVVEYEAQKDGEGKLIGEKFVRQWSIPSPESLAVDNAAASPSKGDVYVAGATEAKAKKAAKEKLVAEDSIVFKFGPEGKPITQLKKFKPTEALPEEEPEPKFEAIEGLAVDAAGNLYLYDSASIVDVFNNAAAENGGRYSFESALGAGSPGLALDSETNLYVGHISRNVDAVGASGEPPVIGKIEKLSGESLIEELDQQPTSSVAVDTAEENLVYTAGTRSFEGKPFGVVSAYTASGELLQRFGTDKLAEASGVAVDPTTHLVYVADPAGGHVAVFGLEPAGPPKISALTECSTGTATGCAKAAGATKLNAQVDPSGAATEAFFEYGAAACTSAPSACAKSPAANLGSGFGDQPLSVELAGLAPGTYHYRAVATNSFGTVPSSEATFTITAETAALPDGRSWELVSPPNKDGAEAEAISREGGTIQAATRGDAISYVADGPMPAGSEPEGNRNLEFTQVISVRGPEGWSSQDISTPHTYGTGAEPGRQEYRSFSSSLALGLVQPFPGIAGATFVAQPPLSPPAEPELVGKRQQEKTDYLRDDAPLIPEPSEQANYEAAKHNGEVMHNAGFLPLVTDVNPPGGAQHCAEQPVTVACFGGGRGQGIEVIEGTPDLGHVLIQSFKTSPGLYEWGGEPSLQQVSVLPGGEVATGEVNFGSRFDVRNAISEDGSLVFWERNEGSALHLFVRNTKKQETVQVDEVASGASGAGAPDATFQTASTDGSRVFFTDTQRLTSNSHASEATGVRKPDLYVFEVGKSVEEAGCTLTKSGRLCDLTPEGVNGESAGIVEQGEGARAGGGVLAASDSGDSVYFVANGALTSNAVRGNCISVAEVVAGRKCNLYVRQFDGTTWADPKLIAVLSNEDANDWGGAHGGPGELQYYTSRVSPSGRFLAFMSRESLTGYNNEDETSKAPGERMDEEVFLYDSVTGTLVCASCNPSGARPAGVFDPGQTNEGGAGEGIGLVIDRIGAWEAGERAVDHWLGGNIPGWTATALSTSVYQSHYLSDSGRLFFNSPDHLVAAATGPKAKVFEYEPNRVGACASEGGCIGMLSSGTSEHESAFIDASGNGNDVFFVTAAKLVPQDLDNNFDVYDAHVCEASSPCTTPPPPPAPACEETPSLPCRAPAPEAPSFSAPATSSITVSGNVTPGVKTGSSGVLPSKTSSPVVRTETKAQKLAKALKSCRKKYKNKHRRQVCERAARKKFGTTAKTRGKR